MNEATKLSYRSFTLPAAIVGRADVARLVRDAETLDSELTTAKVRAKAGDTQPPNIQPSELLTSFLVQNQIQLKSSQECSQLVEQLRLLRDNTPVVHMTFAGEADRESLLQLTQWLRTTIHPQALLVVGVQPGLVGGVYLRTPNRVFDLSLRSRLSAGREVLQKDLETLRAGN